MKDPNTLYDGMELRFPGAGTVVDGAALARAAGADSRYRPPAGTGGNYGYLLGGGLLGGVPAYDLSGQVFGGSAPLETRWNMRDAYAASKGQAAPSSFSYGFNLGDRSVLDGVEVTTGEKWGRALGEGWSGFKQGSINLYNTMTGLNSFRQAEANLRAGNYWAAGACTVVGATEAAATLLTFGTGSATRATAQTAQELAMRATAAERLVASEGSNFVTAPTRQAVSELQAFGLDRAQRRSFFEGKQVIFEDPSTLNGTATILQLENNTLRAGIWDIVNDGSGAILSFSNRSRSLASTIGASKLELFGADLQNSRLANILTQRGFVEGPPVFIDAYGFSKHVPTLRRVEGVGK